MKLLLRTLPALALVGAVLLLINAQSNADLRGQVSGIDLGMCEQIQPDPNTGERPVYCCLDELYALHSEGMEEEMELFLQRMESVEGKTKQEAAEIFEGPYQSPLHERYGWESFCGQPLDCQLCVLGPLCGNSIVQENEECDDGNRIDGDGCSAECLIEEIAYCGDGSTDVGEQCDDGNTLDGDGCSSNCVIEMQEAESPAAPGIPPEAPVEDPFEEDLFNEDEAAVYNGICGNGIVEPQEECDDGNTINGDGCTAECTLPLEPMLGALCGNGLLEANEECDQGRSNGWTADSCRPNCRLAACGDGVVDTGEQCDDGNTTAGDGCDAACSREEDSQPTVDTPSSTGSVSVSDTPKSVAPESHSVCGNGLIEPPEQCDSPVPNAECTEQCTIRSAVAIRQICGDGIRHAEEQCDDGNRNNGDGCSATCTLEAGHAVWCGDGLLTAQEQCDDGNRSDGDGCSRNCRIESIVVTGSSQCGNGRVDASEECDDGNRRDGDGCSATCFWEEGDFTDGIVQRALGERCDPQTHPKRAEYGCAANSRFNLRFCGNGILNPGEECDNGRRNGDSPNALCRLDCTLAGCGDSILDSGEQCDDGNLVNGDGCNRFCQTESQANNRPVQPTQPTQPPARPAATTQPGQQYNTYQNVQAALNQQQHQGVGPIGATGPAALAIMAAGAAGGYSWLRRKRKGGSES